jgi:hypothetical protein
MKAVEWLGKLSKEDQILFCKNRVNHKRPTDKGTIATFLSYDFDTFESFIDAGFVWRDTPEGHEYWNKIYNAQLI